MIYLRRAEVIGKHLCKYAWRKAETCKNLYFMFFKVQSCGLCRGVQLSHFYTASAGLHVCSAHMNTASSSIPSSPTSVFCLFGFLPPFPTSLSCWSSCHRFVHTLGASMFPSAFHLSTFSSVTSCFSTCPVNFKPVDIGGVYCSVRLPDPSSASMLQNFGANISLTNPAEQALSHKTAVGGILLKVFLKPSGCY